MLNPNNDKTFILVNLELKSANLVDSWMMNGESEPVFFVGKDCLAGGGQAGQVMRSIDWSKTSIGAVEYWSPSLRMIVSFLLVNRFPLILRWGPNFCQLYNDAFLPMLGKKHPRSMGQPGSECWPEIWHIIEPLIQNVFRGGEGTWMEDIQLEILRYDRLEEVHYAFAYSPVPDETVPSGIGGVLGTVHEITGQVIGQRRGLVLRDLGSCSGATKTAEEACIVAAMTLALHPKDIPFALIYLLTPDGNQAHLAGAAGIEMGKAESPLEIDLREESSRGITWPFAETASSEAMQIVKDLQWKESSPSPGPWAEPPSSAVVWPIRSNVAHQLAGFLVLGVSARLRFDEPYRDFCELVTGQVAASIANARAHEEERKRARALAEIDRAKIEFLSNVSHEFRTPLTLILGPLEDEIRKNPKASERLKIAHRNSLRLLKLVNALLDFARIEDGRTDAVYEPTDLATATAELAGVFRSAIEKAGLRLLVDCPPLPEEVYVDCEMWEKIVLNLMSNAFKFTLEGEIRVSLCSRGEQVELSVSDTGCGIPAAELPHIFERFHRVRGRRSRTQEGTGIGLSLVQELAKIHGGEARVRSVEGQGSTFTVTILTGRAHLPEELPGRRSPLISGKLGATPFVEESLRWLPDDTSPSSFHPSEETGLTMSTVISRDQKQHPRIIFADDNADMRDYVRRLLAERYEVEAVADGQIALERILADPPDLILSDVMMPQLDGFGLLRRLRANERTRTLPFIMLSAREGEKARIEGLNEGVDDYLIKPFSARELVARIGTHLEMARLRREAVTALQESEKRFRELADDAPLMIWVADNFGNPKFVNGTYLKYFEMSVADLAGQRWKDLVHPDDYESCFKEFLAASAARRPFRAKCRVRRGDGEWRWIDSWAVLRSSESEGAPGMVGCSVDVTEQVRAEERIRELGAIVESSEDAIFGKTPGGIITSWNKGAERIYGFAADEVLGNSVSILLPSGREDELLRVLRAVVSGESIASYEAVHRRKNGQEIQMFLTVSPICSLQGQIIGASTVGRDVTERKRIERELLESEKRLREANEQLHVLSRRLFRIQEDERRHLARELHDQMGQTLTAARIELQAAQHLRKRTAIMCQLNESVAVLDRLLEQVRQLSLELRPPLLDDLGLVPALRCYLDQHTQRAGLRINFFADQALEQRVDVDIETACFRVAQEAVTNVVRHARAQTVSVELYRAPEALHLIARDDGIGFDVATAQQGASLGLLGIRERVALVGGEFDCKSILGGGTEIHAFFPLGSRPNDEDLKL
jgi:PAS domain S-box-containing protein